MRLLYAAVTLLFTLTAHAQTDSVRTTYGEESAVGDTSPQRSGSRFVKAYRKFIRAQVEETTLIKIGGLPKGISYNASGEIGWGFRSEVAVEQKLTPAIAVLLSVRTDYWHLNAGSETANISGLIAGRWYYGMNRRIRLGKSANNFSDQYLTLQTNLSVWTRIRNENPSLASLGRPSYSWLGIAWGAQRRLGKLAYLDFNYGVGYPFDRPKSVLVTLSFLVGLGL